MSSLRVNQELLIYNTKQTSPPNQINMRGTSLHPGHLVDMLSFKAVSILGTVFSSVVIEHKAHFGCCCAPNNINIQNTVRSHLWQSSPQKTVYKKHLLLIKKIINLFQEKHHKDKSIQKTLRSWGCSLKTKIHNKIKKSKSVHTVLTILQGVQSCFLQKRHPLPLSDDWV